MCGYGVISMLVPACRRACFLSMCGFGRSAGWAARHAGLYHLLRHEEHASVFVVQVDGQSALAQLPACRLWQTQPWNPGLLPTYVPNAFLLCTGAAVAPAHVPRCQALTSLPERRPAGSLRTKTQSLCDGSS